MAAGAGTVAAAAAAAGATAGVAAAAVGPGLELPVGGGEDCLTLAVTSAHLHHGWVGEGEEMERIGGRKVSEMNWNEKEKKGGGGVK